MWRNKKLTRLTILPAMLLAAMTSLAAPNEEQGKLLLHKGDSLYRQGNFEEAAIAYLISANERAMPRRSSTSPTLISTVKASSATMLLRLCGSSVRQDRTTRRRNITWLIAI